MKVYTKTGDNGTTSLVGGERVFKTDERVEAYGTVDELTAFAALLADNMRDDAALSEYVEDIDRINCCLMTVAALLATGRGSGHRVEPMKGESVEFLERRIDAMQDLVPQITNFTIPGGCALVSMTHVCRTICRRAERAALCADAKYEMSPMVIEYLNRLSDYFYLLGRVITAHHHIEEILWRP